MNRSKHGRVAGMVVAGGPLLASIVFAGVAQAAASINSFSEIVAREGQSVVQIAVMTGTTPAALSGAPNMDQIPEQYRRFFEQQPNAQIPAPGAAMGTGSGFIISEDGYIMTNAHVVNGASTISVRLKDHRELDAELVGLDTSSDIAVIKVSANDLPTVTIGDSDDVVVGEWVLAIGSPYGFDETATQGIVSAVSRTLPSGAYVPFIQTDVAVNPGNSGGPLFNTDGEVIGVNSQIYSSTGGYQGLSFAIPIDMAMHVADQLRQDGHASRGFLGVSIQELDAGLAESFGLDKPTGALVASVIPDSPANAAGIEAGDVILRFAGRDVETSASLPGLVASVDDGDSVSVTVLRGGEEVTLSAVIKTIESDSFATAGMSNHPSDRSLLGLAVESLDAKRLSELQIEHGVQVSQVQQDGVAAKAGVQAGDVLVTLNGTDIDSPQTFAALASEMKPGKSVPLLIKRADRTLFIALSLPATQE